MVFKLKELECFTTLAFALSTQNLQLSWSSLPLVVLLKNNMEGKVDCFIFYFFAKLLSVFILYLKCSTDVTFCSGRLRLLSWQTPAQPMLVWL